MRERERKKYRVVERGEEARTRDTDTETSENKEIHVD